MKRLIIISAGSVLLLLLALAAVQSAAAHLRGPTWVDLERERLALERAEALAPWQTAAGAALALAPAVAVYVVIALAAAGGAAALARFLRRSAYAHPDALGRLPVLLDDQAAAARALADYHTTERTRAGVGPVPTHFAPSNSTSISYAPHDSYAPRVDYRADAGRAALLPADVAAGELGPVPTFAALLDAGRVGRGADGRALPLLLGIDAESGQELPGSWLDLYSTAVAGLPGAGKTTTQRFLACQTALMGARFVVIDPQAEAGEESLAGTLDPLRSCFLCEPASEEKTILQAVRLVADIGRRRVRGLDPDMTPVILWADELTALLGRAAIGAELGELLEAVAQEYRKKRVFVCGSGQIWTAARTSSELRDSFASAIVHRMKRNQARMLLPTEEAAQAERLDTGQAILWRTSGATATIAVPLTTGADVKRVAGLLGDGAGDLVELGRDRAGATAAEGRIVPFPAQGRPGGGLEGGPGRATAVGSATVPLSAESARILAQLAAGTSVHDLAVELGGESNPGSRKYKAARTRVEGLLQQLAAERIGKGAAHA